MDTSKSKEKAEDKGKKSSKIDLDYIFVEEVGEFGTYQLKIILMMAVAAVFNSWSYAYTFTAARINTRCFIPGCDLAEGEVEFAPSWLLNAVPTTSEGSFDGCRQFGNASVAPHTTSDLCPAMLFDNNTVLPCDRHVYETMNTIVYEFDMGCDEWRRSFVGSVPTFGMIVGLPVSGYLSDRFGRRTTLVYTSLNSAWIGLVRLLTSNYVGFIFTEFMESALGYSYTSAYILVMELVGPKYRKMVSAAMNTYFTFGQALMGLLAWVLQDWRRLTLTLYLPQVLSIFYLWIVPESVRWYMSKGRYEESESIIKDVARVNKTALSETSLQALRTAEEERRKETDNRKYAETWLVSQVFRHKTILVRCLVGPVWWITSVLIYYGLSINAVNMSGNGYLNYVAVCLIEIPGLWAAVLLLDKIGRKPVLIVSFWICAACQIAYIVLPKGYFMTSLMVYLMGKCSIASVMSAVYTYTAELFPTTHRHTLFSYCSMMGRLGSVVAPLTPALGSVLWEDFPFALFAVLSLVSGLLVFVTPETRGAKFPDTMEEATDIGERRLRG